MERRRQSPVGTFYAEGALAAGASIALGEATAHHLRVRRIGAGEVVMLTNGKGTLARGVIARIARAEVQIEVHEPSLIPRPPRLRLFLPVADRDRMLWLAEKSAELAISVWQPVLYQRSLSVSPRGVGDAFGRKVVARMRSALEQSGGAWLPEVRSELALGDALAADRSTASVRYVLERGGRPLIAERPSGAVDVMVGPEGGLEATERAMILDGGAWVPVSLGENTLRFETAGMVAAGMLRAQLGARS